MAKVYLAVAPHQRMPLTAFRLLLNLPVGAFVIFLLLILDIPDQADRQHLALRALIKKLDPLGFAVFAPTSVMSILALELGGNQLGWNNWTVIGLFVGVGFASSFSLCGMVKRSRCHASIPSSRQENHLVVLRHKFLLSGRQLSTDILSAHLLSFS